MVLRLSRKRDGTWKEVAMCEKQHGCFYSFHSLVMNTLISNFRHKHGTHAIYVGPSEDLCSSEHSLCGWQMDYTKHRRTKSLRIRILKWCN